MIKKYTGLFLNKNVLLYDLQRSGTNYLKSVLKNFRVKFLNNNEDGSSPLQKHFWVHNKKEIIPEPAYINNITVSNLKDCEAELKEVPDNYITVSKNPYSWLISYME